MRSPRATYRLQLHPGFGFAAAAAAVPYLAELGISHLYLSPILQAAEGSTHGYDVVDPDRISDALGGVAGFAALVVEAHRHDLGILLDIVPNHMSIAGRGNRWWLDVLENGSASYYAHFFDVDWSGDDRVLLPVLAERYGRALTTGKLAIARRGERWIVRAGDHELPMSPRSLGLIARRGADAELQFIGDALAALPTSPDLEARRRRHRDRAVLLARLAVHAREVDAELDAINSDPAELDAILEMQAYRLAHWSVAGSQLPYRRFFDINTLAALRNEDPDVFAASHARVLSLVEAGDVDGLRVDHVDGLRDPATYLARLHERAPHAWIVVEKIVTADETLPGDWPIDGTTGYDFMEKLGGLFVDPDGEAPLTQIFEAATGTAWDPVGGSRAARREVMTDALHSEVARLSDLARRACAASPTCRDYTPAEIETALVEILAGYPVYRTYLGEARRSEIDRARIASAVAAAQDARPDLDRDLLAYLEAALAFELTTPEALELARSAQQVTGAITAKGDEDTLLYRQVRLIARNEVGAELRQLAHSPESVHHWLAAARPRSLLATSTHDSKRSEDVRARIAVISELPEVFGAAIARWRARADRHWDVPPDRVFEHVLWQTLLGAWPLPLPRAKEFARKATREARLRTSWRRPDAGYEAALERWLDGVYGDTDLIADVARLSAELAPHGDRNSLAQLLVKLVAPGVPDFYQGTELRDDSLVDPDNRRTVDLAARRERLRWVGDASAAGAAGELGAAKLWTIRRVLALRRRFPERFEAPYRPLDASGPHARRVFAFARGDGLVAIVPRLSVRAAGWPDTTLAVPPGPWRDVLADRSISGGALALAELWRTFPIALLARP